MTCNRTAVPSDPKKIIGYVVAYIDGIFCNHLKPLASEKIEIQSCFEYVTTENKANRKIKDLGVLEKDMQHPYAVLNCDITFS